MKAQSRPRGRCDRRAPGAPGVAAVGAGGIAIVGADGLGTGPSRDGFATRGLGAPLGCVYARLTGAVWGLSGAGAEWRCCMKTGCGRGGLARTVRDASQEPHYRDAVEGSSHV